MGIRIRYRPNREEFGRLMLSEQTQDLAMEAARRMRDFAKLLAGSGNRQGDVPEEYTAAFRAEPGPPMELGGNLRATARVVNDHWLAAIIEFGSGVKSVGDRAGTPREQGGYSAPHRYLGRAGAALGSPPVGEAP
jgi:hypothetical protein